MHSSLVRKSLFFSSLFFFFGYCFVFHLFSSVLNAFYKHNFHLSSMTSTHWGSVSGSGLKTVLSGEYSHRSHVQKEREVVVEQQFALRSDGFLVVTVFCTSLTFVFFFSFAQTTVFANSS